MTAVRVGTLATRRVGAALAAGRLNLHLGPFSTALQSHSAKVTRYFCDLYRDCLVTLNEDEIVDYTLRVGAPNLLRRFVRPQIVPDPGFHFPALPLPAHMAPLALEMGMNLTAALQCFRFVMFHAGVVAKNDNAVMIAAHSGGGKSTLTAAMMEAGYRLLSDEFAILHRSRPVLQPYPRPVSLKNASIDVVQAFAGNDAVSTRLEGTPKGTIAYRRARRADVEAMNQVAVPKLLIFPHFTDGRQPGVTQVEPADAAMRLVAGSPNYQVVGEAAFESTMAMFDSLACYEISYGNTEDSVRLVEDLFQETGA
ncbi:HprK-related kinase A [Kordiimonas aestuarii]|uniref:HprK-related kinase A n=1 Tax=Kordiimonas aestuarii TaxID=1005925 RepID=UPI0021D1A04A|nr:HprK-related kinase A [Kordiimonas aestuarii]